MNIFGLFQHPRGLQDLTPIQLTTKIGDGPSVILVDVRTTQEYKSGHISGAVTLPWGTEHRVIGSQAAAATLLDMGYSHISHLKGGMGAWRREGNPVEK